MSSHGKDSVSSLVSFLIRTLILSDQSLTLVNSFNLNYLLTLNIVILRVGRQNMNFWRGGGTIQSITYSWLHYLEKSKEELQGSQSGYQQVHQ